MSGTFHYRISRKEASPRWLLQALLMTAAIFLLLPALELGVKNMPDMEVRKVQTQAAPIKPPAPPKQQTQKMQRRNPMLRQTTTQMPMPVEANLDLDLGPSGDFAINMNFNPEIAPENLIFEPEEVDRPPMVKAQIAPVYPYAAKRQGVEGYVTVRFVVDENGTVRPGSVQIVEEDPRQIFSKAAEKSVMQWRFEPGVQGGEAVAVWVRTTIRFELNDE